jgi:flagellar motor switch protein FliG
MNPAGLRKSALYLASLAPGEQRALLAALPAEARVALVPLIAQVTAQGWQSSDVVSRVLAEEMRGLTSDTALSIDALLAMAKVLSPDWTARVFAANAAVDSKFLLAVLDKPLARRVQTHLEHLPRLPDRLREAVLAEAAASIRSA